MKYHDEGLTQREIGEECGVSPRTIRGYMKEFDIETRDVEGENHGLYGEERDEEVKAQIAESLDGRDFSAASRDQMAESHMGSKIPASVRNQISESLSGIERSPETREKMSESRTGEANPNWRGGGSIRYGPGWKPAREKVRKRDEVCRQCGHDGSERELHVHHIIPVREFREAENAALRDAHDLSNLVLLCYSCHYDAEYDRINFESGIDHPASRL
ncbi:MAG: HNH endonuclease [Haloarculaceae archaeon]